MAPSQRGLSASADWGSVLTSEVHYLHHCVVPLKVNCPKGAREATLGCPLGGRQEVFVYNCGDRTPKPHASSNRMVTGLVIPASTIRSRRTFRTWAWSMP